MLIAAIVLSSLLLIFAVVWQVKDLNQGEVKEKTLDEEQKFFEKEKEADRSFTLGEKIFAVFYYPFHYLIVLSWMLVPLGIIGGIVFLIYHLVS